MVKHLFQIVVHQISIKASQLSFSTNFLEDLQQKASKGLINLCKVWLLVLGICSNHQICPISGDTFGVFNLNK